MEHSKGFIHLKKERENTNSNGSATKAIYGLTVQGISRIVFSIRLLKRG